MFINKSDLLTITAVLAMVMQGCQGQESKNIPIVHGRDGLTYADLMQSEYQRTTPLENRFFMPISTLETARHGLEGRLIVPEFKMNSSVEKADTIDPQNYFPGFSVEFFTLENNLVPVARDVIYELGDSSYWRIILSPGTVWYEPGDRGMSRASFPFTLVSEAFNEAHNGLATFLYDYRSTSSLFLQIVQETAPWNKTDYWGKATMKYEPHSIENRSGLASRFIEEQQSQIPILPFSDLSKNVDPDLLETFNIGIECKEISATGLIWNDTLYLQPCNTRYGEYPYPRYMRHGAFSLTKAMAASVALLRLAEKYGDEVFTLKIEDYLMITADHGGWKSVTFADALNMATGVGDHLPERVEPNVMQGDEEQPKFFRFLLAKSKQEKLDIAFSYGNYPWRPGEVARYNSINTFLLSSAMDSFLKRKEGPDADIWEMVLSEVYRPIGILNAPIMRTIESGSEKGLPPFGYGLYPTVDDVAKLSILMKNGGRHDGRQLLHAEKLAETMFRTEEIGLPTGEQNEYGSLTYHLSFNSFPYRSADGRLHRIPCSTGYGGNHWVLLPNGIATFRFTDANRYGIDSMINVAEVLSSFE